jgi:chromosome segregation ATPase
MALKVRTIDNSLAVPPVNGSENQLSIAVKGFFDGLRTLTSQENCKLVEGYFNENERLKGELKDKEQEFAAHTALTTAVAIKRLSLEKELDERNTNIAQLTKEKDEQNKRLQELEESCKTQKETLGKARGKVLELNANLKEKDEQIQELKGQFNKSHTRASELEKEFGELKIQTDSLGQRHDAAVNRLTELQGFAVALHKEDPEAV